MAVSQHYRVCCSSLPFVDLHYDYVNPPYALHHFAPLCGLDMVGLVDN
jgi:hypothetical protein